MKALVFHGPRKGLESNNIYITNDTNGVLLRAGSRPEA